MTAYLRGEPGAGRQAALLRVALNLPRQGGGSSASGEHSNAGNAVDDDGLRSTAVDLAAIYGGDLTPSVALTSLSYGLMTRLPSLEVNERIAIEAQLSMLTSDIGTCEKLLRTPIPLGYTRYSVRFLWIWLTLLPFALTNTFVNFGVGTWWEDKPKPVLVLAMLFIGFIFLSIEDIAVQIEEPFAILPLEQHQRWLVRDARQMKALFAHLTGLRTDEGVAEVPAQPEREMVSTPQEVV